MKYEERRHSYDAIYEVRDDNGLHARPTSQLVDALAKYSGEVLLKRLSSGETVNGKGIMQILPLRIPQGELIKLSFMKITGCDEERGLVKKISQSIPDILAPKPI